MGQAQPLDADRLLTELVDEALERRATDIHLTPAGRTVRVGFRVDGLVHPEQTAIGLEEYELLVGRIKVLADLNIAERRRPQAGAFVSPSEAAPVEIRVSFLPTVDGESTALRLLTTRHASLPLSELGLPGALRERVSLLAARPSGLLLVVGPTGSGKTTTLYALAEETTRRIRRILSVEEPVERRLSGVTQVEVSRAEGIDFAEALRAVLRHDPDVIVVGEVRDLETAQVALAASLSGHLVLASMHADGPLSAVERLVQLGIDRQRLGSVLIGVLAQRLVRVACTGCAGAHCTRCRGTGFAGRTGLFDLRENEPTAARSLVERSGPSCVADDVRALVRHGLARVSAAQTTREEVARVLPLDVVIAEERS